jgi:hypothetical protein
VVGIKESDVRLGVMRGGSCLTTVLGLEYVTVIGGGNVQFHGMV